MKWAMGRILVKPKSATGKIFCEQTAPQAKLIKGHAPQARLFRLNPNEYFVLLM